MTNNLIVAWVMWLIAMTLTVGVALSAQPKDAKRPFSATQSGGNCVYIVDGKYANFIAVVPVGQGGC